MADQTQVALDLAGMVVTQTGALLNSLEEFEALTDWRDGAGIVFTDYESEIAASESLKHAEGAHYNKVSGVILPDLITYLETTTISGGPLDGLTYKEVLQRTRRE